MVGQLSVMESNMAAVKLGRALHNNKGWNNRCIIGRNVAAESRNKFPALTNHSDSLSNQRPDSVSIHKKTLSVVRSDSSTLKLRSKQDSSVTASADNDEDEPSKLTWFIGAQLSRIMNFESRNDRLRNQIV